MHLPGCTIDDVRGASGTTSAAPVLAFWERHGALTGAAAQARMAEVVCVLRDADAAVAGVSSVFAADVPLIGGRRFWVMRSLLPGAAAGYGPAMITATFAALAREFDEAPQSPVGLCVLLAGAVERARRPQAEWGDPRMIYAGYLEDGRQVRIAYFPRAIIGPSARHA